MRLLTHPWPSVKPLAAIIERMDLGVGDRFERYTIQSVIGRGGMGVVYLARDERLGRHVALKVLGPEVAADPSFRARFEAEARLAASLDEPHVVPIYTADEHDGRLYIVMRYVAGSDLEGILRRDGPLDPARAVGIVEHVAAALDAAHARSLVHRDVKPANVLVAQGLHGEEHAYLTDFGIALMRSEVRITVAGQVVGTLEYIAPEQISGAEVDHRADVYALGGLLHTALTAQRPFRTETDAALLYAHLNSPAPTPSALAAEVPAQLDVVVARAMAKRPEDRFSSAGELARAARDAVSSRSATLVVPAVAPASVSGPLAPGAASAAPAASPASSAQPAPTPDARTTGTLGRGRKTVTILFTDLVGSSPSGEVDPEALDMVLQAYFDETRRVVERHGGIVEKFIGDAVVGIFGVPLNHEDDALRAVRAGAEIDSSVVALRNDLGARLGLELTLRVAINTGEVMAGGGPGEPIVVGDAVNAAARIHQIAEADEIVIGDSTMRLVRTAVVAEAREPVQVRGAQKPVAAFTFRSLRAPGARAEDTVEAPLVGRADDLESILDAWARVNEEGSPRLVTVMGGAGLGKSRLVREVAASLRGARVLAGHCLPYGEGITYWPIRQVLQAAAGVSDSDAADVARGRVAELVAGDSQASVIADRLAMAVGLTAGTAPQQEIFWSVRRLIEELGRKSPTLLVLEDLHWAEPTLLDLIEYVLDVAAGAPVLLLATSRPDLLETRPGWSSDRANAELIRIAPLAADDAHDLVRAQLGGTALPVPLATRIVSIADGNPLYIEEMVAILRDDKSLHKAADGTWEFSGDAGAVTVPSTIRALVNARLDRLPEADRQIAERAAVIGRSFDAAALGALLPDEAVADLPARLRALVRREILQPDRPELMAGDAFRFRHVVMRDAAYDSLPKSERARLHRRVAEWLVAAAGERLPEFTEIIGYHLEQAYRFLSVLADAEGRTEIGAHAADYLALAARRAHGRGEPTGAEALLLRALAVDAAESGGRAERLVFLGRVQRTLGRFDAARASLVEAREIATKVGAPRADARAAVELVMLDLAVGDRGVIKRDEPVLERARATLTRLEDDFGLAICRIAEGSIHELEGRNSAGAASFNAALEHAIRAGDKRIEIESLSRVVLNLILGEAPVDVALERCEQVLATWDAEPKARASMLDNHGLLLAMAGRHDEALRAQQEALAIAIELDDKLTEGLLRAWGMASVLGLAGDHGRAVAEARRGCELLLQLGERSWLSSVAVILGELELVAGDARSAERWLRVAADVAVEEDVDALSRIDFLGARLTARAGDVDTAAARLEARVNAISRSELVYLRGLALAAQAEVLHLAGLTEQSRRAIESAIELHRRKGDTARATRAQRVHDAPASAAAVALI